MPLATSRCQSHVWAFHNGGPVRRHALYWVYFFGAQEQVEGVKRLDYTSDNEALEADRALVT